ncbi:glycosyltransferase family 4 protein [Paenirhodobacter populi]|nr:glycosyltransferase family 4 protein [Sinirhodobacter populi]
MNEVNETKRTDVLTLPADARNRVHEALGISPEIPLKVSYLPGPGDVLGTYRHWQTGVQDPRVPVISYSAMFYELMYRLGAQVEIISPVVHTTASGETEPWLRFVHVARQRGQGRISYHRNENAYIDAMCRELDRFQPHVVLASSDMLPRGWPRVRADRKLILTAHNSFWPMGRKPTGLKARARLALLERHARALDAAVCTSEECMRQIREVTGGRITGLVQCPQLLNHYPTEERQKARNLLYLGRIEANKGIFMLLDVFSSLKPKFPDLTLTFAGTGSADAELQRRIDQNPLPDIRFPGKLDAEGVHRQIAQSDLIICPTTTAFNEGLAMVGVEAAAHGLPTLLSTVVPVADILGKGCVAFEADDVSALHRALENLLSDNRAYQDLLLNARAVCDRFYNRSQSWGSQLGQILMSL